MAKLDAATQTKLAARDKSVVDRMPRADEIKSAFAPAKITELIPVPPVFVSLRLAVRPSAAQLARPPVWGLARFKASPDGKNWFQLAEFAFLTTDAESSVETSRDPRLQSLFGGYICGVVEVPAGAEVDVIVEAV